MFGIIFAIKKHRLLEKIKGDRLKKYGEFVREYDETVTRLNELIDYLNANDMFADGYVSKLKESVELRNKLDRMSLEQPWYKDGCFNLYSWLLAEDLIKH